MIQRFWNNRGRMTGAAAIMLLLAGALSGCVVEHEVDPGAGGKPIRFTPEVSATQPGTRAASGHPIENGNNIPSGNSFGVYAYSQDGVTTARYDDLQNTKVTRDGNGFTYAPTAKWPVPTTTKLAFYGYYPWQDQDPSTPPADDEPVIIAKSNDIPHSMTILYTTPTNPRKQIDLMYAYTDFREGDDDVEMDFRHALTRINFRARVEDYNKGEITSITINNILTKGTLTVEGVDTPVWSGVSDPENMELHIHNGLSNVTVYSEIRSIMAPHGDLLLIPQSVQDLEVEVKAQLDDSGNIVPFTFPLKGMLDWDMNKITTYDITLSPSGITLTASTSKDWIDGNDIDVITDGQWSMTVEKDKFDFGLNGDPQTFVVETDYPEGISLGENNNDWLTVTGTGDDTDTNRTFTIEVDPFNNASREGEFTIMAGNLKKVIHVRQASITDRFAKSNIVWVPKPGDPSYPDGGYLTFATTVAENATVAPAKSQGVFFKWGSLVAVSPVNPDYTSAQWLFSPSGASYGSWASIPYVGNIAAEQTGKWDDGVLTDDDFAGYGDGVNNTSGPGFATAGANVDKGDICRYITSRGWVPAGTRWRMPTAAEYQELIDECTSVPNNGSFTNIPGGAPDGNTNGRSHAHGYWPVPTGRWLGIGASNNSNQDETAPAGPTLYFPAGGLRLLGEVGFARQWGYSRSASSTNMNSAVTLFVYNDSAGRSNPVHSSGVAVRCIRE